MNLLRANVALDREDHFQLQVVAEIPLQGVTAIYGPSGCGKTSLLYCLAGLLQCKPGSRIHYGDRIWQEDGTHLPVHERRIGFVFQDGRLFPHLNVAANLAYAEKRQRGTGPTRDEVCDWLQLQKLLDRGVAELSQGQQQRVAIARALLSAPDILFLDEPLANLDLNSRAHILRHLERVSRELSIPIIYVSHEMEEVARLADWLMVMEEGRLIAQGPTLELCSRLELALAHEEQAAAIVQATLIRQDNEFGLTELELENQPLFVTAMDASQGAKVRLRLPARDVSLCLGAPSNTSILNVFKARITDIESSAASRVLVRLQTGEQFLLARVTRKSIAALGLKTGDMVYAQVKSVALLNQIHD
jgi:molybdate transport system ATP-binding protein